MQFNEWLSDFVQLLVLIPAAISCYLPTRNQLKYPMTRIILLCCAMLVPFALAGAAIAAVFHLETNIIMLPALSAFFFLYRLTVKFDLSRTLAVYVGVCAIQTFPAQFANIADTYLKSEMAGFTLQAAFIQLGLSCLLTAVFVYPARNHFSKAVDEPGMSGIWYSTVALSSIFLIFNLLAIPIPYETARETGLQYLFPALELCGLALLIMIYVLFYRGAIIIIENAQLEKRSQLLEMQTHQFRELQEYLRRTRRLRHDFRQSVHLLSALAENGDLDSIRTHLSQYEQRLMENVSVNYCANTALNALFSYYHELAVSAGIKTDWKIELPDPLTVSELDMAALFGNLMENAIDACSALPADQRYFSLTSHIRHGNTLYVISTNSFDGQVRKYKDGYLSTKHNGRGTGLTSITAVAEKYNGTAQIHHDSRDFFVDVVMKI